MSGLSNLPTVVSDGQTGHLNAHRDIHNALKGLDGFPVRVEALESMNGVAPESPVDGQTANLVLQETTLTRGALEEAYASESLASARAQKKLTGKKMVLVLRHDDVQKNALQYLPLYDELGVKASWYVATAQMGETHRTILMATPQDIIDLHRAGHEIGSHTQTHLYFHEATEDQRRSELAGSKRDLEALLGGGYRCETFAYPGNWGVFDREVGDYYIWGSSGVAQNDIHGDTYTGELVDTVANSAEYPRPLMGETVAETITKTKAVIAQYKARPGMTIFTLQSHNLNEVPLEHMRAILETVLADPDAAVATMAEVAHYVRSSLHTRDGRYYGPWGVTDGHRRKQLTLDTTVASGAAVMVDRVSPVGYGIMTKVDGEITATLDDRLTLRQPGASRFENGHRLQFHSPDNAERVTLGHEAGGVLTLNLLGNSTRFQVSGRTVIRSAGNAFTVSNASGSSVFNFNTDKNTLRLFPLTELPTGQSLAGEVCVVHGTLYVCRTSGEPGQWVPVIITQGTTSQRPTSPIRGQQYWDTTLGRMIWWTGSAWVAPVTEEV